MAVIYSCIPDHPHEAGLCIFSGSKRDELFKPQQLCASTYFEFTELQSSGKEEEPERREEIPTEETVSASQRTLVAQISEALFMLICHCTLA